MGQIRSLGVVAFVVAGLVGSGLGAQLRPARSFGLVDHRIVGRVGGPPWLSWGPEDATIHVGWPDRQCLVLPEPIERPGAWWGGRARRHLLLCGGTGRDGRIARFERVAGSFEFRELVTYRERDWIGCCFVPEVKRLYVLDERTGAVLWSNYELGAALPRKFQTLIDRTTEPAMRRLDGCGLTARIAGRQVRLRICAYYSDWVSPAREMAILHGVDGSVEVSVGPTGQDAERMDITAMAVQGASRVPVVGPSDARCQILRLDGGLPSVVGAGRTDGRGMASIGLAAPVALGGVYVARSLGQPNWSGRVRFGHGRQSAGDVVGVGYRLTVPIDPLDAVFAGGAAHLVVRGVHDGRLVKPAGTRLAARLVVGALGDPVVRLPDGRSALAGQIMIETDVALGGWSSRDRSGYRLDVPNDPGLIGGAIRYQWWVDAGTHWLSSEIVTRVVRADRFTSARLASLLGILPRYTRPGDLFGRHWSPGTLGDIQRRSPAVRRWLRRLGPRPGWRCALSSRPSRRPR